MITVIGSINMDLVVTAKRAPDMGETVMGTSWTQIPGGKGANQAVAAARSGGETWMVGRLGQDAFGNTLLESLKRDPLHIDHIEIHEDAPTGIAAIVVDSSGRNRITVISGANYTIHADDINRLRPLIARSSVLLMQLEIPLDAVERALIIAKEEHTFSILNPAPATELPDRFYRLADLMTPNESELAILSGCPTQTEGEWIAACRVLLDRGLSSILVTLGDKGAFYMDQKTKRTYPAYSVSAVDTTAAGDSFNGTLAGEIARYLKKNSTKYSGESPSLTDTSGFSPSFQIPYDILDRAVDRATRAAAITVTRKGAQPSLPTAQEIDDFDMWYETHSQKRS